MGKLYILGERHDDASDIRKIATIIRRLKPAVLGHELLYQDICTSQADIEDRLRGCKEGGVCDPRLNKDIYELGKELHLRLVGIDLDDASLKGKSLKEQFALREAHFIEQIDDLLALLPKVNANVVIVVGDAHLRHTRTDELGPASPLVERYAGNPSVIICRTDHPEVR